MISIYEYNSNTTCNGENILHVFDRNGDVCRNSTRQNNAAEASSSLKITLTWERTGNQGRKRCWPWTWYCRALHLNDKFLANVVAWIIGEGFVEVPSRAGMLKQTCWNDSVLAGGGVTATEGVSTTFSLGCSIRRKVHICYHQMVRANDLKRIASINIGFSTNSTRHLGLRDYQCAERLNSISKYDEGNKK